MRRTRLPRREPGMTATYRDARGDGRRSASRMLRAQGPSTDGAVAGAVRPELAAHQGDVVDCPRLHQVGSRETDQGRGPPSPGQGQVTPERPVGGRLPDVGSDDTDAASHRLQTVDR